MIKNIIIAGSGYPDLEELLVDDVGDIVKDSPLKPLYIIVRSNYLAQHLRRRLVSEIGALLNIRILTLLDIVKKLSSYHINLDKNHTSQLMMKVLLRQIIQNMEGKFTDIGDLYGLCEGIVKTFTNLREGGVLSVEDYEDFCDNLFTKGDIDENVVELFSVLREAREILEERGYFTDEDCFHQIIESEGIDLDSEPIMFYGFYDFNHIQRLLVEKFSSLFRTKIYFPIPLKDDDEVIEGGVFSQPTLDFLREIGYEFDNSKKSVHISSNLDRLKSSLIDGRSIEYSNDSDDKSFMICSSPNPRTEIGDIARKILKFADSGVKFYQMAVITNGGDDQRRLIEDIFNEYDIPYFTQSEKLADIEPGKALIFLIDLILNDYERDTFLSLLRYIRKKYFKDIPYSKSFTIDRFRELTYRLKIFEGYEEWIMTLDKYIEDLEKENDDRIYEGLLDFVISVKGIISDVESSTPQLRKEDRISEFNSIFKSLTGKYFEFDEHKSKLEDIFEKFEDLSELVSEITFENYLFYLRSEIEDTQVNAGRLHREGVHILDMKASRGLTFEVVFLPQLQEGVFPHSIRQDPFLLDSTRKEINKNTEYDIVIAGDSSSEDRLLFDNLIFSTRSNLILSYSRFRTLSTKEYYPSHLVLDIIQKFTGEMRDYDELDRTLDADIFQFLPSDDMDTPLNSSDYDLDRVRRIEDNYGKFSAESYLSEINKKPHLSTASRSLRNVRPDYENRGLWNIISNEETVVRLNDEFNSKSHSVTSLESYANCPLNYLYSNLLNLKKVERPELLIGVTPMERGIIVHRVYLKLFNIIRDELGTFKVLEVGEYLNLLQELTVEVFDEVIEYIPRAFLPLRDVEIKKICELSVKGLQQDIENNPDWHPRYFEASFGKSREVGDIISSEPVEFYLDENTSVKLSGSVDRIDIKDNGVRVIDYKTGRAKYKSDEVDEVFRRGELLQLPVYLLMYLKTRGEEDLSDYLLEYQYIKEEKQLPLYEEIPFRELKKDLKEALNLLISSIKNGIFIINPPEKLDGCKYCDFQTICDYRNSVYWGYDIKIPGAEIFYKLKGGSDDE